MTPFIYLSVTCYRLIKNLTLHKICKVFFLIHPVIVFGKKTNQGLYEKDSLKQWMLETHLGSFGGFFRLKGGNVQSKEMKTMFNDVQPNVYECL